MEYKQATKEMMEMVKRVAVKNHPRLKGVRIAVVLQEKASKNKGKIRLAFATKPSPVIKPHLEHKDTVFVICIAQDEWDRAKEEQREALVDHELCHCGVDDGEAYLRPHDYEEFAEIVKRHGFWRQDPAEKAMRQVAMALSDGKDGGPDVGTLRLDMDKASGQ